MALTTPGDIQNEKTNVHKPTERKEKPMTKVIIRRLPPNITQEEFLTQVSPIPDFNYMYTVKGDMSLGENAFSRVYINFINIDDIYNFKEKFDNYVFVDLKGHEYSAVVEFASFQKIPKKRNKSRSDPKCNSIDSDPIYLEFIESLKIQPSNDEKPEYSYQPSGDNKIEDSTPLLDYVKQRHIDRQRIREEKREERKRKEIEKKKIKDDERRKRYDEKSPTKSVIIKAVKNEDIKEEKTSETQEKKDSDTQKVDKFEEKHYTKYRDRKYEDRKPVNSYKSKYGRNDAREYGDKRDYKSRREDYRDYSNKSAYESFKREPDKFTKKVKKYSERREERKSAFKKYEDGNEEASSSKSNDVKNECKPDEEDVNINKEDNDDQNFRKTSDSENEKDCNSKSKNKENDPRIQRRIRNKDRPTMAIYQPGMLRKKAPESGDEKSNKSNAIVDKNT